MAIEVTALGTDIDKGGDNLTKLTSVVQGDLIIVCLATDETVNAGDVFLANSTWQVRQNLSLDTSASNAGNVVCGIWSAVVDSDAASYDRVVVSGSGGTAKVLALYKATGMDGTPFDKSATATGSGTTAVSGATATLSQADELAIGAIGMEEQTDEKGTWTTGVGYVSGNEQDAGTTGAGGASNVSIFGVAEIVAATTAQEAEQTSTGDNDWAACIATYKGVAGGWTHKFNGVANASIGKINGVAIADIAKVNGVV